MSNIIDAWRTATPADRITGIAQILVGLVVLFWLIP